MSARKRLAEELGADVPEGVAELDDDQIEVLAESVVEAKRAQRRELAAAADSAFDHIPRLLRKPVRKILGA